MSTTGPANPAAAGQPSGHGPAASADPDARAGGRVAGRAGRGDSQGAVHRPGVAGAAFLRHRDPARPLRPCSPPRADGIAARGDGAALWRPGAGPARPGLLRRARPSLRRCGHRRFAGAAVAGAPDRPRARRGTPQAGGAAAGRADRRAAVHPPRRGCVRLAERHGARRPRLAGSGVPAGEAAGNGGRGLRRLSRGRRAGQPDLPILVAVVPQPPAGRAAAAGRRAHPVRLAADRHLPRHLCRLRGGCGDAAGGPLGGPGGQLGGPLAHARPARARPAGAAGRRPGADQGAGGGGLGRAAAPGRAGPARRRADPAGDPGHEPRHGQGEARRRCEPGGPRADRCRPPGSQGRPDRAAQPGPGHPPARARQRPGRRAGHPRRQQRHPGRADHGHPAAARAGDRDDRLLLRRRAAGQRGQAQPREHESPST